ncbi:MAG: GNAT family N-acetyltransferase [Muribaculaceae bacterium]|nr:GNAT family N-acetyltransferase [Muribaculaceae bacterium]
MTENHNYLVRDIMPEELPAARSIYMESFPPEERREWGEITEMAFANEDFALKGIFIDGKLVGIGTRWNLDTFLYIEHLAIDSRMRGHGLGRILLNALCMDKYNRGTILEVEPETDADAMTVKRIAFYKNNGFRIVERDYIQPPYSACLPSVPLWLMACGEIPEVSTVASTLHRRVYKT